MTQGETGPGLKSGSVGPPIRCPLCGETHEADPSLSGVLGDMAYVCPRAPAEGWLFYGLDDLDTISNGPGLVLPEDPDELLRDLQAASERIRAIGPIPRRIRVASTTFGALLAQCSVGHDAAASQVDLVIDNTLPMRTARVEWSDGTETTLDLRRAADAREET